MSTLVHFIAEKYRLWSDVHQTRKITRDICHSIAKYCEIKQLTKSQNGEIQNYWQPLVGKTVDTRMHQVMLSMTGIFKPEFEPFEICREIQNRSMVIGAMRYLDDKNLYRSLLAGFKIPARLVECNNGVYYLPELGEAEVNIKDVYSYLRNVKDCIIKPSIGTDGGNGVCSFDTIDGNETHSKKTIEDVLNYYGNNFCIERKVHECDNLQRLNPTSCNTIRVHTMRDRTNHKIRFLSSYIRIGKGGQVVDNMHSGGTGARIWEDGSIRYSVSCYPYKKFYVTDSGIKLDGYVIENHEDIVNTCLAAHSKLPMFDLMGWDVAVDEDGNIVIIEYNPNPDVRIEQAIFGDSCLLENQVWVMNQFFGKSY